MSNDKNDDDKKDVTIIVNGRERTWPKGADISFEQVVGVAFPNQPPNPDFSYTVAYSKGDNNKPQGSLVAGESVKVKKDMVFNVTQTNRS